MLRNVKNLLGFGIRAKDGRPGYWTAKSSAEKQPNA